MQNRRYLWFAIVIGIGLIIGLLLGWNVFAPKPKTLPLTELRMDYKADYVLMVAKYYEKDKNLDIAKGMLAKVTESEDEMEVLVRDTLEILNNNDAGDAASTADIQSVFILLQAISPDGAFVGWEVPA